MFGIGEDKKKKKTKKPSNVFRKCRVKGYIEVYSLYLFELSKEMEVNSTLRDCSPFSLSKSSSSSVQMIDSLLCWMFQRKEPIWTMFSDKGEWKKWIALREDHWIVNETKRSQLISEKMI